MYTYVLHTYVHIYIAYLCSIAAMQKKQYKFKLIILRLTQSSNFKCISLTNSRMNMHNYHVSIACLKDYNNSRLAIGKKVFNNKK